MRTKLKVKVSDKDKFEVKTTDNDTIVIELNSENIFTIMGTSLMSSIVFFCLFLLDIGYITMIGYIPNKEDNLIWITILMMISFIVTILTLRLLFIKYNDAN